MKIVQWLYLCALAAVPLRAGLITTAPSGTTTVFDPGPGDSSCPTPPTDAGFALTAIAAPVCVNSNGWGFGTNGSWAVGLSYLGNNSSSAAFKINLGGLYSSAGFFMNYDTPISSSPDPMLFAIGADGTTVLESYDLAVSAPISTPGGTNAGAFRGISRPTADIHYLELADDFTAAHSITPGPSGSSGGVPEPSTLLLIAPAALLLIRRRR